MPDKNGNGIDDSLEGADILSGLLAIAQNLGTGSTNSSSASVPSWLFNSIYGTSRKTDFVADGSDTITNYAFILQSKPDSGKAYAKFAKYITGNAKASVEDVNQAWNNTIDLASRAKIDTSQVISNKAYNAIRFNNTTLAASAQAKSQRSLSITSRENANSDLQTAMSTLLGRQPTKVEYSDYLKKLNAAERSHYRTTRYDASGSTTTGTQLDPQKFLTTYVLSKASWAKDLKGDLGVAQDTVGQLLADNGLSKVATQNMKIKYLQQFAKGELSKDALNSQLAELAATTYPAWSAVVKPGMSMRDAAASWLNVYQNTLEVDPNTADLSEILSKSVDSNGKVMSVYDFQKALRKDPRYQYTNNAHQEAAAFGRAFAQSMGVNL